MKASKLKLSSSEWKKINAARKLSEVQQIRNLRTNAAILKRIEVIPVDSEEDRNDIFIVGMN